jgi:hypothetical protein
MKQIENKKISPLVAWLGIIFSFVFALFFILATFVPSSKSAIDDNISGWGWSPLLSNLTGSNRSGYGFTSFNDCYCIDQPQGQICNFLPTIPCVSDKGSTWAPYGLRADLQTREITGWVWNQGVGWICFGNSCCNAGGGKNYCTDGTPDRSEVRVRYEADQDPAPISGWAKIIAATSTVSWGSNGWISLGGDINCGEEECKKYGLRFSTSTLEIKGLAWNAFDSGAGVSEYGLMPYHGFGWLCINEEYNGPPIFPYSNNGLCPQTGVQIAVPYIQTVDGNVYS